MKLKRTSIYSAAAFLFTQTALAATVREVSFDHLCERAEAIICATAREVRTEASPDGNHVLTFTRFDNLVWVKGDTIEEGTADGDEVSSESYEVCTLGGRLGNIVEKIPGMPQFEIGNRYILFVEGNGRNICPIVGVHQGCFHIEQTEDGNEQVKTFRRRVINGVNEGELQTASPSEESQASIDLLQFLDLVKKQLDKGDSK